MRHIKRNRNRNRPRAIMPPPPPKDNHVVLLGDSILDNQAYVKGGPDVTTHLTAMIGSEWDVSLRAIDGATTFTLPDQLKAFPDGATQVVVSVGGNDALGEIGMLTDPEERTMKESLNELGWIRDVFEVEYANALAPVLALGLPVAVCTIYDCDFPESGTLECRTALALFNDVIIRYAHTNSLHLIDLRLWMGGSEDYEMNIEPSMSGGWKVASAIAATVAPQVYASLGDKVIGVQ